MDEGAPSSQFLILVPNSLDTWPCQFRFSMFLTSWVVPVNVMAVKCNHGVRYLWFSPFIPIICNTRSIMVYSRAVHVLQIPVGMEMGGGVENVSVGRAGED